MWFVFTIVDQHQRESSSQPLTSLKKTQSAKTNFNTLLEHLATSVFDQNTHKLHKKPKYKCRVSTGVIHLTTRLQITT